MNNKKKVTIGIIAVVVVIAILLCVYFLFGPKGTKGAKAITIEVTDDSGETTSYDANTDAEFLREAMDEVAEDTDFSYDGNENEYGIYITAINGITADYDTDGAYWAIYVNGDYGMYGADAQPVADGDTFSFVYEVYTE